MEHQESLLVQAHVYERKIEADTFKRESASLREAMDLMREQIADSKPPSMKIEEVLSFAHQLLADPAHFWQRSAAELRPRIQAAIYPDGLRYNGELIGTAETSLVFSYLFEVQAGNESMARREGFEPPTLRFEA